MISDLWHAPTEEAIGTATTGSSEGKTTHWRGIPAIQADANYSYSAWWSGCKEDVAEENERKGQRHPFARSCK